MKDRHDVQAELQALESGASLDEPANLSPREEALCVLAFLEDVVERWDTGTEGLRERIDALRGRFEAANERLFAEFWALLAEGPPDVAQLRRLLDPYTAYRPSAEGYRHMQYEALDVLLGGVFGLDEAPEATIPREPGMVHLEFTPASVILELADRVPLAGDDVFVDLGAGLGQVVILVHLATGVRARGVEVQPGYAAQARRLAEELHLVDVTFENADAREAELCEGTVFYLFTPFIGDVLQAVLDRLREVARQHPIRVCSYGGSTLHVAKEPWLRSADGNAGDEFRLAVFASA